MTSLFLVPYTQGYGFHIMFLINIKYKWNKGGAGILPHGGGEN